MKIRLLVIFLLTLSVNAETVYKTVDDEGNIIFTDKPVAGAEEIKIRKTQTVSPAKLPSFGKDKMQEESTEFTYTSLSLVSPENDSTIHSNEGNLLVTVSLEPTLRKNDELVLSMDGRQLSTGKTTRFSIKNIDRGTHNIEVMVLDENKEQVIKSDTVVFHMRRTSKLTPGSDSSSDISPLNPPRPEQLDISPTNPPRYESPASPAPVPTP